VLTFERWEDNVLRGDVSPWPPHALYDQVIGYVARRDHFDTDDAVALAAHLGGRISKVQSVNSEDAVTFSWFGTLAVASTSVRSAVVQWLYSRIGLATTASDPAIDQWVRVFHPNAPGSSRGPELDARVDDANALIYVEAKWSAGIGTGRGSTGGVPDDQIVLRRDSLRNDPLLRGDTRALAVLGVSETRTDVTKWDEGHTNERPVTVAWLTWDELAECPAHPFAGEFRRYLDWKRELVSRVD
jgi:hypothetical protein